jgi:hypothetical protein
VDVVHFPFDKLVELRVMLVEFEMCGGGIVRLRYDGMGTGCRLLLMPRRCGTASK